MSTSPLGRTLVIANPAAHSGRGAQGATFAERFLASYSSATRGYELRLTTAPGDAELMAAEADGFDTVVALGGDGVIHEVANGLMRRPAEGRAQLGVIPLGSGNDYARTLGMARNDVEAALAQAQNHGQQLTRQDIDMYLERIRQSRPRSAQAGKTNDEEFRKLFDDIRQKKTSAAEKPE